MTVTGYAPPPRKYRPAVDRNWLVSALDLRQIIQLESRQDHGDYISGRCPHPSHEDMNPSFIVSKERYRCMATGAHGADGFGGTVIDWYCFAEEPSHNLSFPELLNKIAQMYGVGVQPLYADFNKKRTKPTWTETIPDTRINPVELSLLQGPELEWFAWRYQLDHNTIWFERIGYYPRLKSFTIPIWDSDHGSVISIRYRRFDDAFLDGEFKIGTWTVPRYYGFKGHNPILLYNRWRLKYPRSATVRICFGELTALFVDRVLGLDAVTVTNGAKAFKPYFCNLVRRVYDKVIVLPDGGELLEAVGVSKMFGPIAQIVMPLENGDIIDWCREGLVNPDDYLDFEIAHLVPYDGIKRSEIAGSKLWLT